MPPATGRDPGGAVLSDLPAPSRWDFGGFAYGLEPLVLPPAGRPHLELTTVDGPPLEDWAQTCRRIDGAFGRAGLAGEGEPCEAAVELYWFRWITGHQVCFVLWRLIAELLEDVRAGRCDANEIVAPTSTYVDGYAAMLLYTGSCTRSAARWAVSNPAISINCAAANARAAFSHHPTQSTNCSADNTDDSTAPPDHGAGAGAGTGDVGDDQDSGEDGADADSGDGEGPADDGPAAEPAPEPATGPATGPAAGPAAEAATGPATGPTTGAAVRPCATA